MNITNFKTKAVELASKVESSKAYKAVEKCAVTVGAGVTSLGFMAMNAFAESGLDTLVIADIKSGDILGAAKPFINAGIPILAIVGGIKLGVRFLRSSMH